MNMKFSEESDIDSPRETFYSFHINSPTLIRNEQTTNFRHSISIESPVLPNSRRIEIIPSIQIDDLLKESEYLVKHENWNSYIRDTNSYTSSTVKKQNLIWELVCGERNYLQHLYRLKKLYKDRIPMSHAEKEKLFPHLEKMLELHSRLFKSLFRKHIDNNCTVLTGIGQVFLAQIDESTRETFKRIYGEFSYAYGESLRYKAKRIQNDPANMQFFNYIQTNDPDHKKGIDGYLLIINQRWTKVEPLLNSLIDATLENDEEKQELESARDLTTSILSGSQAHMMKLKNDDTLRKFKNGFKYRTESNASSQTRNAEDWITENINRVDFQLENFDRLKIVLNKKTHDAYGVAFDKGFFIVTEASSPDTYHLLISEDEDQPVILKWGYDKPLFRETAGSTLSFYLIIDSEKHSKIYEIHCSTPDDCQRWKNIINKGLNFLVMGNESIEEDYQKTRDRLQDEYNRNLAELQKLASLDDELITAINSRNNFLQTFFNKDFTKTIEELSLNRPRSYQDKKEVVRTSSGTSIKNSSKLKPPINEYSLADHRYNSGSSVELRYRKRNEFEDLNNFCIELLRIVQDRKPSSISRSSSSIDEKNHYRSDSKSKSKIPGSFFQKGSREKSNSIVRKQVSSNDDSQDAENEIILGPDEKFDDATLRDRVLFLSRKINGAASSLSEELVRLQEESYHDKNNLLHLKKENENLNNFRTRILKNIMCENCKRELETSTLTGENAAKIDRNKSKSNVEARLVENEKLRAMRVDFERRKAEWEKEQEKTKNLLERQKMKLNEEREMLAKREEKFKKDQENFDEEKKYLQFYYDNLQNSNGVPPIDQGGKSTSLRMKNSVRPSVHTSEYYTERELDHLNDEDYINRVKNITDIPEQFKHSRLNQTMAGGTKPPCDKLQPPSHLAKKKKSLF